MTKAEFEQYVLEDGKDILRFCRMMTGSTQEGDELYQDTMLKLLEQQDKLNPCRNIKSYAIAVSVRLWKNKKRKYAWRKRIAPSESYELHVANGMDVSEPDGSMKNPEQKLLQDELIQTVRDMVMSLPEKFRTVIHMYYSADMTVKEISDCLKLPEGTVKSRLRRAKMILKKELEVTEYDRS